MGGSGVYRFLPKKEEEASKNEEQTTVSLKKIANRMHCPNFFWGREGRNRSHTPKIARQDPPIKPAIKGAPPYYMRENNCSEKEKKAGSPFLSETEKTSKRKEKEAGELLFF